MASHNEVACIKSGSGKAFWGPGDKAITASAGDLIHIPKGTPHSFKNEGDQVLKMIVTFTPAGIEGFFEEGFYPAPDRSAMPPMPTQELIVRLVAAAPKYGLEPVLPAHE